MTITKIILSLDDTFYTTYLLLWTSLCILALWILVKDRKKLFEEWQNYYHFLFMSWKLLIFIPALIFVTFAGSFTDDETWDIISGFGMSLLTFLTAPWVIGIVYQIIKFQRPRRYIIVAISLCLFSSSWFYDGYLFLRDGEYTTRWLGNLLVSPTIYMAAGFLWNLESTGNGTFSLSFLRSDWPTPPEDKTVRSFLFVMLPLILIAIVGLTAFVGWNF